MTPNGPTMKGTTVSDYPPIPGVKLGEHERIIDHGTLLGYPWWLTILTENDGTDRYVADFIIPADHPASCAYRLDIFQSDVDRALRIPYNDDIPHVAHEIPNRSETRIVLSSFHIRHTVHDLRAAVTGQMRSLILGYHQAATEENHRWCNRLTQAIRDRDDATKRVDHLLGNTY